MICPLSFILLFSLFTGMIIAGTASIIVYVPFIRENIPGYTNPELEQQYATQQKTVISLEKKVEQQDSLLHSFQRIYGIDRPSDAASIDLDNIMAEVRNNLADDPPPSNPVVNNPPPSNPVNEAEENSPQPANNPVH